MAASGLASTGNNSAWLHGCRVPFPVYDHKDTTTHLLDHTRLHDSLVQGTIALLLLSFCEPSKLIAFWGRVGSLLGMIGTAWIGRMVAKFGILSYCLQESVAHLLDHHRLHDSLPQGACIRRFYLSGGAAGD